MKKQMVTKGWKGLICFMAATILLLALSGTGAADDRVTSNIKKYPDVPSSHWAYIHVLRLTYEHAITGMPDGTFGPERSITRAEFVTVVVGALLGRPETPSSGQHWAANNMKAAEDSSMLEAGEFAPDTWNTPITRQEMAKIMVRATQYVQKEAPMADTAGFTAKVPDFASISADYQPYIAQAFAKGLVTGYPDGSFGGGRQATRAEASTMVVRLLDPAYRLCEITFDPKTDVAADGRMKLAKAEQYLMKNVQSLKFYEENGKVFFEGNVVEVPEGFENRLVIDFVFKNGTKLPIISYSSAPFPANIDLPSTGSFKEEVNYGLEQIDYIEVTTSIDALEHTNTAYEKYGFEVCWLFGTGTDNRIDTVNTIASSKETHKFYDLSQIFQW